MSSGSSENVTVGLIREAYGVRGWVKIQSYTEPAENIVRYTPWRLHHRGGEQMRNVLQGRRHNEEIVAQLEGVNDRDEALALKGALIVVQRSVLPRLVKDEYYWVDLIGLDVMTEQGVKLGVVQELMETGANDVLVVKGECECLIPFLRDTVIKNVDRAARRITVDWDVDA